MRKFFVWLDRWIRRHASRGVRITMLEIICTSRRSDLEFAEIELRQSMREWALQWRDTGDYPALVNAIRFRAAAETIRQVLEVTE